LQWLDGLELVAIAEGSSFQPCDTSNRSGVSESFLRLRVTGMTGDGLVFAITGNKPRFAAQTGPIIKPGAACRINGRLHITQRMPSPVP
jgi:hypothetical protein